MRSFAVTMLLFMPSGGAETAAACAQRCADDWDIDLNHPRSAV
jgi:hypothetical protein